MEWLVWFKRCSWERGGDRSYQCRWWEDKGLLLSDVECMEAEMAYKASPGVRGSGSSAKRGKFPSMGADEYLGGLERKDRVCREVRKLVWW